MRRLKNSVKIFGVNLGIILVCLFTSCINKDVTGESQEMMTLVKDKVAEAVVVIPQKPAVEIKRGADALAKYINEMSGANIDVVPSDRVSEYKGKIKIYISLESQSDDNAVDVSKCEKDGYWIKTLSDDELLITGKTPYGTEFGVYGFLQKYCGVRWYLPGPEGTYVPQKTTITIPRINFLDNPVFVSRNYSSPTFWGGNYPCAKAQKMDMAWYRHNRMKKHFNSSHNLGRIIVPSTYGKSHPEYFPFLNGKRYIPKTDRMVAFQPCMTNDEVVDLCVKAAVKFFDENPDEMSFSIGINDWGGFCRCDKCKEVNGPEQLNSRGLPDSSKLLFHFANRVAAKLPKRYKDRYVGLLAYAQARDLPEGTKLDPNLLVTRVSAFLCYFNPMDRVDMKETARFAHACKMFGIYDYWYGTGYAIPVFGVGLMEEYLDFLTSLNTRGWTSEIYQNWTMDGIKYYLLSQKLWNPSLRVKDMLQEFCKNMFGKGSGDMLEFYRICQDRWESQNFATSKYHLTGSAKQAVLFDESVCKKLMSLLDSAKKKCKNQKGLYLLDHFIKTLTYTQACAELMKYSLMLADQGPIDVPKQEKHVEEDIIPQNQYQLQVEDIQQYTDNVLNALRCIKKIKNIRNELRKDPFSLPRKKLAKMGGMMNSPETITAPLLKVFDEGGMKKEKTAFLDTVKGEMPELFPKIGWIAEHMNKMADQPELIPNGSFEELAKNRYDAKKWVHGNWGSKRSTANSFVVPQGIVGKNCYYLAGIKSCFTYLPSPVIKLRKPLPIKGGKWYCVQAKIRSSRNDGVFPEPTLLVSFPGKRTVSVSCNLSPGHHWFDAVWIFQAPKNAKEAIIRFMGTKGLGQAWIDSYSMKQIPDEIAPKLAKNEDIKVYPPLGPSNPMPDQLIIDFVNPLPPGASTKGEIKNNVLINNSDYNIINLPWYYHGIHDLEIDITASSPDGATLGVKAITYAMSDNGWVKIDSKTLGSWKTSLSKKPKKYTFKLAYKAPIRKILFIVYRSQRQGTLKIDQLELIPKPNN